MDNGMFPEKAPCPLRKELQHLYNKGSFEIAKSQILINYNMLKT